MSVAGRSSSLHELARLSILEKRALAVLTMALVLVFGSGATPPPTAPERQSAKPQAASLIAFADAPKVEQEAIQRMLADESWARRAVAAMRLERYDCDASRDLLLALLRDKTWQVRCFAIRTLAHRQITEQPTWFEAESDPRVIRTALRYGYSMDNERLARGVRTLAQSNVLRDKLLAAEIGSIANDPELLKLAQESVRLVILRMNRTEAGAFSPRLALLTGQMNLKRPHQWQQWLTKTGRNLKLTGGSSRELKRHIGSAISALESEQFVGLENYMSKLAEHEVDLAIALDCTASMSGEIMAAQGGIDDMMTFVGDVVDSVRLALIAYRDRGDEFETKAWPFADDVATIREQLWLLSADGGGDEPEAVYPAMRLAFTQLQWRNDAQKVFVIVGDAPPHPGYGAVCAKLAKQARDAASVMTHVVQAKGKDVKHFAEIAEGGGGRCVTMKDADTLMAEITGLTLGDRFTDEFREFYRVYLELCR